MPTIASNIDVASIHLTSHQGRLDDHAASTDETLKRRIGVENLPVAAVKGRGSSYFCGYLHGRPLAVQDRDKDANFARMQRREIITAARCLVALLMHWPVVPLADGVRTIS